MQVEVDSMNKSDLKQNINKTEMHCIKTILTAGKQEEKGRYVLAFQPFHQVSQHLNSEQLLSKGSNDG